MALRYGRWKIGFAVQGHHGFGVWQQSWTTLRVPLIEGRPADRLERAEHDSEAYHAWLTEHLLLPVPAQA